MSVGVVAIDGTKLHAIASRDATLDYEQVAREILEVPGGPDLRVAVSGTKEASVFMWWV